MKDLKSCLFVLLLWLTSIEFMFSQTKISGYLQYMYRVEFEEDKITETFTPGTINLKVGGSLSRHVKWAIQFGVKELSFNKFLKDCNIELVDPFPGVKGFEIRLGQFKYHWSIERKEASSERKTIYRSQVVSALVADRDRGLEISYAGVKNFYFALGLWNGEVVYKNPGTIYETIDYTRNMDDSDAKKDITGYVSYDFKGNSGNLVTLSGALLIGSNGRMNVRDKERYGFGLNALLVNSNLHLRGEFIFGNDGDIRKRGYYMQLSYKFFDYFEPVIKYESWDNDINVRGESKWLTVGVYSKVMEQVVFRFNYVKKVEKPIDVNNDELMFMAQVSF